MRGECLLLRLHRLLNIGDVFAGVVGFAQVRVDRNHFLKMAQGGVEFGDAAALYRLTHVGEAQRVVRVRILGIVRQRLLAIGDRLIELSEVP